LWSYMKILSKRNGISRFLQDFSEAVPKAWTGETAISPTTEWGTKLDRSGDRRCDDPSKHNGGRLVSPLLDKHSNSEKKNDSQETDEISIQTSESIVNLDKSLGKQSCISSHGVNSFFKINTPETPSENKESFVWSVTDRSKENEGKVSEAPTGARLREPSNASAGRGWESINENGTLELWKLCRNQRMASVIHVEAGASNKDAHNFDRNRTNKIAMQELSADDESQYKEDLFTLLNFNRNTTNKVSMQELSADDGTQHEDDLHSLLNLLKNKYSFRDETNKNILYDYEIRRFAEFYNITDFFPVLAYYDLIFWLQVPNGDIYMWSRTDESMILGGHNMKEALMNFLFYQENLRYIEEYTHKLLSVKEVKEEADKWYEESKETAIKIVPIPREIAQLHKYKKNANINAMGKKEHFQESKLQKKDLTKWFPFTV
ncbi:2717_t:CDS:2, partial [Funneliformis geosporum]